MSKRDKTKNTLMNTAGPFGFEPGAMRTKRRGVVDRSVDVSLRENIGESLEDFLGTTVFFEIIVDESNFHVMYFRTKRTGRRGVVRIWGER